MYRTHHCGALNKSFIGKTVTLSGWVQNNRDFGKLTFIDLRDRFGITQIVFNEEEQEILSKEARQLGREFVIQIEGTVIERSNKNLNIPTGEIEIAANTLKIISKSETPPFTIIDETDGSEELRLKHRYLDIRRPIMRDRLITRAKMVQIIRAYLDQQEFVEIETPTFIKSTPEGARDFLVPSRLHQGQFYALPQSPQILKQLLMVSGMDRYYQIVKCYRDEDFRGDRQPEFTQVDCEMSFVHQEDVLQMFEGLTKKVFQEIKSITLPDFQRISFHDAMKYYGSDKPDLRFDCKIIEIQDSLPATEFAVFNQTIANKGIIAGLNAKGCAAYTRKQLDHLTDFVKEPHRGLQGLVWIRWNDEGIKSSVDKFFNPEQLEAILELFNAEKGDLILIAAEKASKVRKSLGDLRLELAKQNQWYQENQYSVLWVIDFPLFEEDEDTGETIFMHHPFCMPHENDLQYLENEPLKVKGQLYDLVINGNEVLSGSIRIHDKALQDRIFKILGMSETEIENKFGFMVNAFKYGAPPHGGCAFGLDRWVLLLTGGDTIRDVIAFPKSSNGKDMMMDAPTFVDVKQLDELGIQIKSKP
jgi:aspartyl-tRNA synthetase